MSLLPTAALMAGTANAIPLCGADLEETAYGAFLMPSAAGSCVLVGVAAFALGVLVMLLCLRARRSGERLDARPAEEEAPVSSGRASVGEKPEETQHTDL